MAKESCGVLLKILLRAQRMELHRNEVAGILRQIFLFNQKVKTLEEALEFDSAEQMASKYG